MQRAGYTRPVGSGSAGLGKQTAGECPAPLLYRENGRVSPESCQVTAAGRRDLPWLHVPGPLLRVGLGEASVELLSSTRVIPRRLVGAGYQFRYSTLPEALAGELAAR